MPSCLLAQGTTSWEARVSCLLPGSHVVLFTDVHSEGVSIRARMARLELRDTILILRPGPVASFALLLRKPLEEISVVQQALKTGTGVLNTDACRVRYLSESDKTPIVGKGGTGGLNPGIGSHLPQHKPNWGSWKVNHGGRWPPNLLLIHTAECIPGVTRVEGHKGYPNGPRGSSSQFSQKGTPSTRTKAWAGHADEDGLETVPAWTCKPACPVPFLGEEASRFFPQFQDEVELFAWFERLLSSP